MRLTPTVALPTHALLKEAQEPEHGLHVAVVHSRPTQVGAGHRETVPVELGMETVHAQSHHSSLSPVLHAHKRAALRRLRSAKHVDGLWVPPDLAMHPSRDMIAKALRLGHPLNRKVGFPPATGHRDVLQMLQGVDVPHAFTERDPWKAETGGE